MIKVLHITENPIAGAPISLSKALNKYQGNKVSSRHLAQSDRNENRIFDCDMIIDHRSYEEIRKSILDADVLHFHNFYKNQHLFRKYPDLWPLVGKKKRVWQAHTQRNIAWMNMEEGLEDKGAKHLVIGQYHPRMYPECEVVPNIVDIYDPKYLPNWEINNEKPRVAFSPSRIRLAGWDNKGYDETVPVLQELVDVRAITAEVIYNTSHADCLNRRRAADISIDEIVTGSYHLVSLESLSQGLATIAGLDDTQVNTLRELTGSNKLPWFIARPDNLKEVLKELISDRAALLDRRRMSRAWMENFWCPKITTERFYNIYKGL